MTKKTKKMTATKRSESALPLAVILAGLLNPGTPWRD